MSEGQLGHGAATPDPAGVDDAAVERALQRRRRGMVLTALGVLVGYAALIVVLSLVQSAPPTRYAWVLLGVVVVLVAVYLWPLRSAAARTVWADRGRRQGRIDAALHDHVSIGREERDEVTAQAEARRSLTTAPYLGYPLLVVFVAFLLFNADAVTGVAALLGTLVALALCGLALLRSRRRAAEARRWLDDPLPPGR
jgi:4-amino-4-deoxy-L-arabinose transferase-like glycosyltransferase